MWNMLSYPIRQGMTRQDGVGGPTGAPPPMTLKQLDQAASNIRALERQVEKGQGQTGVERGQVESDLFNLSAQAGLSSKDLDSIMGLEKKLRDGKVVPSREDFQALKDAVSHLKIQLAGKQFHAGQTHYDKAVASQDPDTAAKEFAAAEGKFRKAIKACPSNMEEGRRVLSDLHHNLARVLDHQGKTGEAIQEYNNFLAHTPDGPACADIAQRVRQLGGEPAKSLVQAREHHDQGSKVYGEAQVDEQKKFAIAEFIYTESLDKFKQSIAACPPDQKETLPDLHYNYAKALEKAGFNDEAAQHYVESLKGYFNNGVDHYDTAAKLEEKGDRAGALREYQRAAAIFEQATTGCPAEWSTPAATADQQYTATTLRENLATTQAHIARLKAAH